MPRRTIRRTDFETRVRNMLEIEGKHGIGGLSRLGGGMAGVAGLTASSVKDGSQDSDPSAAGSAQLLCMSVTAAEIASGGAIVPFDTIVAQHGFDGTVQPQGGYWTHPISGVYVLTYEHAWDSYEGGGTVQLEVDEELRPEGVLADGTAGSEGRGTLTYYTAAGSIGRIWVDQASGGPLTCSALMRVAITDPGGDTDWELVDTLWIESRTNATEGAAVTSSVPARAGHTYRLTVTGNIGEQEGSASDQGAPDLVLFPSSGYTQTMTATNDAEVMYANSSTFGSRSLPQHHDKFRISTGSGFSHVEADGGPFTAPSADHTYSYTVVGAGSPLAVYYSDSPITDNNGQLRVDIYRRVVT